MVGYNLILKGIVNEHLVFSFKNLVIYCLNYKNISGL